MMPGVQFLDIRNAIVSGYNENDLREMLRIRLDTKLDDIVAPGAFKTRVFDLLEKAESQGWLTDLVREGYLENPRNPGLLAIYRKYGLAPGVSAQQAGAADLDVTTIGDGLQGLIRLKLPPFDFGVWREKMALVEGRVIVVARHDRLEGALVIGAVRESEVRAAVEHVQVH